MKRVAIGNQITAYKKAKKALSPEQQAIVDAYRKNVKSSVDLTAKFREQGKGEGVTIKFVLREIRSFERGLTPTLSTGRMTFIPIFPQDLSLPESFKSVRVEHEKIGSGGDGGNDRSGGGSDAVESEIDTRPCLVFVITPNNKSRKEYDEVWGSMRTPIKHFEVLQELQLKGSDGAPIFNSTEINGVRSAFAHKSFSASASAARAALARVSNPTNKVSPPEARLSYEELRAKLKRDAIAKKRHELGANASANEEATEDGAAAAANAEAAAAAHPIIENVDREFGIDKLPENYEIRMRNGLPCYGIKLPKEKCKNVEELLNSCFGDLVTLSGLNFSAYVWEHEPKHKDGITRKKNKEGEEITTTLWPKRATINTFADSAHVDNCPPATFKMALEAVHQASPAALVHPIVSTVWQDVFSSKQIGKLHSTGASGEMEAFNSMASVLRVTSEPEEERLATQRAGIITEVQEFIEDDTESMLTSSNKKGDKFMALKVIADMKTWWPLDSQTQAADLDDSKSFQYRSALTLRSYQEHLFRWVPMRSVDSWKKVAPSLLANFSAYMIFSRDVDSAWNFEETRSHESSFRAPFTTNAKRLSDVQIMETGYMKRWAIDMGEILSENGVPLSAAGAKWLFEMHSSEVPRCFMGENAVKTSELAFALNELSESDLNSVLNAAPGTYRFYAVTPGWSVRDEYADLFEQLHECGAVDSGENLASALFHRKKAGGDFVTPHPLVEAASLPTIPLSKNTYVFAVNVSKHNFQTKTDVLPAMCKILGYDAHNVKNTVEKMCADIARQAAINDEMILPKLQRIKQSGEDGDLDDDDMLKMLNDAEQAAAGAAPSLPPDHAMSEATSSGGTESGSGSGGD